MEVNVVRYMGGKARIGKQIVVAIMADTSSRDRWWEPFVGGANVIEHAAPHFASCVGTDVHPDLIMLWRHVTGGGSLPEQITREQHAELKRAEPSWLRGAAGFGGSFGGRWFGGYGAQAPRGNGADNVYPESRRAILRQASVFAKHRVGFAQGSYVDFEPPAGSVIYCDPPYAGTKFYSSTAGLDYQHFYATIRQWAWTCDVYVSEYAVPEGVPARVIWEREKRVSIKVDDNVASALERLFKILP